MRHLLLISAGSLLGACFVDSPPINGAATTAIETTTTPSETTTTTTTTTSETTTPSTTSESNTATTAVSTTEAITSGGPSSATDPSDTEDESTTVIDEAICGDGVVQGREECDDGELNAPEHSCKEDCTFNICGDGALGPGEECDDGNLEDGDGCSATCTIEPLRAFVTNRRFTGDLKGIDAADAECALSAAQGGLGGQWKAWLSATEITTSPSARFTADPSRPYVRVDGVEIAANWDTLVSEPLAAPIVINEYGASIASSSSLNVWTNVGVGGLPATSNNCDGWTSPAQGLSGGRGRANTTDFPDWSFQASHSCNNSIRLYCFEQ